MTVSSPSPATQEIVNLSNQYAAALDERQAAFARMCADNTPTTRRAAEEAMKRLEEVHAAFMNGGI